MPQREISPHFGGSIVLADALVNAPVIDDAPPVPAIEMIADQDTILVGVGGAGGEVVLGIQSEAARDGRRYPIVKFDTDYREIEQRRLPDGREVAISRPELVPLAQEHSLLDELDKSPALQRIFLGPEGLFRGITALERYDQLGFGTGGLRPVAHLAYLISQRTGQLETRLRQAFRRAAAPIAVGEPFWGQEDQPAEDEAAAHRRRRIVVIGGGSGSVGAAGLVVLPAFIRRVARRLWTQEPVVYGVVLGPHIYTGLTPRTLTNWAATMMDLDQICTNGTTLPLADGSVLRDSRPAYWRVFSFDDPNALETIERNSLDDTAPAVVPESVRQRFHSGVARTIYQALASDALDQFEASAINGQERRPWGTMIGAVADLASDQVRTAAVARRVANRLEAAART